MTFYYRLAFSSDCTSSLVSRTSSLVSRLLRFFPPLDLALLFFSAFRSCFLVSPLFLLSLFLSVFIYQSAFL